MNEGKRPRPAASMRMVERSGRKKRGLGPEIQQKIGQQLRAMYSDVVSEGVPDRFTDLLRQLDEPGNNKEQK